MSELAKLFEVMKVTSKHIFEDRGGLVPMFLSLEPALIIPVVFLDLSEKRLAIAMIKALFNEHNVKQYGFAFEAWIATTDIPKDGIIDVKTLVPPSQRPDRQEAILVMAEEKGLPPLHGMWPITRDKKGRGKVGDFQQSDDMEALGVFRNMLGTEILH